MQHLSHPHHTGVSAQVQTHMYQSIWYLDLIRMYSHLAEWVWNVNIENCTCLSQKQIPPSEVLSDANMQLRMYIGVDDS